MRLKKIFILITFICQALFLPCFSEAKEDAHDFTIVIDAGHGGKDIGATDNGAREKDINLAVALQLESIIKKKMKSAKVVMTRKNDTYLTLQERADKANQAKGDLFISIHTNSVDKSNKNRKTVSGSSVYALGLHKDDNNMKVAQRENSVIELESNFEQKYSGFDPSKDESYIIFEMAQKKNLSKSIKFAEDVQNELVDIGRGNRGVHQAGFWVLWATSMPAVLIELDFICNPGAAKYMTSEKGQKEFASAIFKAIEKFEKSWEKSRKASGKQHTSSSDNDLANPENDAFNTTVSEATVSVAKVSNTSSKKKKAGPAGKKSAREDYATARRRRRSEDGRAISDSRNYETSSIPLHTESERAGGVLAYVDEESTVTASSPDFGEELSDKDKKSKKKKEKKAKKEKQKKQKRKDKAHNAKIDKFVKVYKIQILASADLLKQSNPRFCGLSPISVFKESNLYKYYYGESAEKAEIEEMLKEVKKKIPDAFIVSSTKSMRTAKN